MTPAGGHDVGYIRVSSFSQNTDRQLDGIELQASSKPLNQIEELATIRFAASLLPTEPSLTPPVHILTKITLVSREITPASSLLPGGRVNSDIKVLASFRRSKIRFA